MPDVTVTSAVPNAAVRGVTLDVAVNGAGFDNGTRASFLLKGVEDPRVHVNSTRFVKTTQVVANVTIAGDADPSLYDIAVVTAADKKGIGTEAFTVQVQAEVLVGGGRVTDVNGSLDAVGRVPTTTACASQFAPVVWHADGSRVDLPRGSYCGGSAAAITRSGTILGSLIGGAANSRGLWTNDGSGYVLQEIAPAPDGYRPIADRLNDANEIIGWGQSSARLYWWSQATGWLSVPVPAGATLCQSPSINNRGEIVVRCSIAGVLQAFYWSSHTSAPQQLPRPAGISSATALDINDSGVIVGNAGTKAALWTPNGSGGFAVTTLNDGGSGATAYAIANDGTVVGSINRSGAGSGPLPVYWPQGAGYRRLALPSSGSWGEALAVASDIGGLVIGGHQANTQALRWHQP